MNILQSMSLPRASIGTCLPFGVMACSREKQYKEKKRKIEIENFWSSAYLMPRYLHTLVHLMQSNHNHSSPPRSDMHIPTGKLVDRRN
jgi:hypothetical protein